MSVLLQTWRKNTISLSANVVYEMVINPVYKGKDICIPNIFVIQNKNTTDIVYFAYTASVSSSDYVGAVNPLTFHRHISTINVSKIYLVSASNCTVEVSSAFDPAPNASDYEGTQNVTILNQSLTVGNVGITSIAAGDNNIGNVDIASALPAGDNNIGNVDIASALPAGDNNIGNVDIASALPAGSNTIGYVMITDGTDVATVDASGYLNVNVAGGTVNVTATEITVVDSGSHEWNINADGSGDVNILNSLPAGDNNIGNVDVVTVGAGQNLKPATTPVIYNVTCTTASSEYSQALPANCKIFQIGLQSKDDTITWKLKFGASGTERTYNGSESPEFSELLLASQTLYFETDNDGEVMEIVAFS